MLLVHGSSLYLKCMTLVKYILELHGRASGRGTTPNVQAHVLSVLGDDFVDSRASVVRHVDGL